MTFSLTAPCHFGLEKTLAYEVKKAGGQDVSITDGRVSFTGDENVIAMTNISCRTAERVGIVLASFRAETYDDIFDGLKNVPIEAYAGKNDMLHVKSGHSVRSKLTSIPAIQKRIKKALISRMSEKYGVSVLPEDGAELPVSFLIMKDIMTVTLDTSGEGLHKRGYRALSNAAPISETLVAGLADLARVRPGETVIDPFCGSGTILIEAALKAKNIAPCLERRFAAMNFGFIDKKIWEQARENAKSAERNDADIEFFGYDIDPQCVKLSEENSKKAGVGGLIRFEKRDIKDFHYPYDGVKVITNPPYAMRMGEENEVKELYGKMGSVLLPRGTSSLYIITPDEEFEQLFGEKATKTRKLYNGMIMCRLYSYAQR